jgi:hypothetical protein
MGVQSIFPFHYPEDGNCNADQNFGIISAYNEDESRKLRLNNIKLT